MYIRTKDGVYVLSEAYWAGNKDDILKQSENLEELCDEFVYQTGGSISKGKPMISKNDFLSLKEWYVTGGINQNNIFGAIWTDKGLIYVAKMNENGELCLL